MKIRLGYVAISLTLNDYIHYKTLSYSQYQKLGSEKANKKLTEIILNNFHVLFLVRRQSASVALFFMPQGRAFLSDKQIFRRNKDLFRLFCGGVRGFVSVSVMGDARAYD